MEKKNAQSTHTHNKTQKKKKKLDDDAKMCIRCKLWRTYFYVNSKTVFNKLLLLASCFLHLTFMHNESNHIIFRSFLFIILFFPLCIVVYLFAIAKRNLLQNRTHVLHHSIVLVHIICSLFRKFLFSLLFPFWSRLLFFLVLVR